MADSEHKVDADAPPTPRSAPVVTALAELRLPVDQLPRVHEALARALGEAGVGGHELHGLFASGVRAVCVGCGLGVTGAELGEFHVTEERNNDRVLPPKLERLRLGFCPRNGCEARFFNLEITAPGRFDRGLVLGRTQQLLSAKAKPLVSLEPVISRATRRATQRLALIALGTLLLAFVAYRLVFYRSQLVPFIQPKSPYTIEPASIDPNHR